MATYANLTVNAKDILGDNFDPSRASVWIEANTPHSLIVVDGTNVRVGGRREKPDANGTVVFENLVTTNSADNPTTFAYRVTILYVPKGSRRQGHDTWTSSDFSFTATGNLASISEAFDGLAIAPTWQSEFRAEMEDIRDGLVAISGPVDATVEALVKNTGGVGPLTQAAVSTTISAAIAGKANTADLPAVIAAETADTASRIATDSLSGAVIPDRPFQSGTAVFNLRAWHNRRTRAAAGLAFAGVGDLKILCIGDSNTHGLGAFFDTGDVVGRSYPERLGQMLTARGYAVAEGACWLAACDGQDSRWDPIFGVGESDGLTASFDGGGYGVFTSSKPCTGFEVTYLNAYAGDMGYQVDGGATQTVTRTGAGGYARFIVSGLTSGIHNIKPIGAPTSAHIAYVEPIQALGRVRIHKAGVSGSKAAHWAAGTTYLDNALSTYPDVTVVSLGSNDIDRTPAQYAADIGTIVARVRDYGSGVIVVGPPARAENDMRDYYPPLYARAVADDFPVVDLRERVGAYGPAKADGYFTDYPGDTVHQSVAGLADKALAVGQALTLL